MAYIEVDVQKLWDTAFQIRQYITAHKNGMQRINGAVKEMQSSEVGEEFSLLQQKWDRILESQGTSQEMLRMLDRYASYLESCARNYETAQNNASIRASWI